MTDLRPYQVAAAETLAANRRLILGMDIGLGKTRTALHAAKLLGMKRVSVAAPAVVRDHWIAEAEVVGGIEVQVESFQKLVMNKVARLTFTGRDAIFLDEVQAFKRRDSQRTKMFLGTGDGLVHRFPVAWGLSGTPMPRNPGELFPILYALWPDRLAAHGLNSYMEWLNRFTEYHATQWGLKVTAAKNIPALRAFLTGIIHRVRLREVAPDLPPLRTDVTPITAVDVRAVFAEQNALPPNLVEMILDNALPPFLQTKLARLRHVIGDVKVLAYMDLVRDELDMSLDKRVVFAYHHSVLDALEKGLAGYGVVRIDGETSNANRALAKAQFRQDDQTRVIVIQIVAGGVGLDGLQYAAHQADILEPVWDASINVQATGRLARMGQTLPVHARIFKLAGTLDEALVRNHFREMEMVMAVMG